MLLEEISVGGQKYCMGWGSTMSGRCEHTATFGSIALSNLFLNPKHIPTLEFQLSLCALPIIQLSTLSPQI